MKLLLVDDDCDQVDLLTYAFQRHGYSVATAGDGRQALARWQSEQPDLVVLDVNLPKVNGFEVCRQIRRGSNTPVILLTARAEESDVVRGLQVGADDYVTKPFSAKQLTARVQAVLRRYQPEAHPVCTEVRAGDLVLNLQAQSAEKSDRVVELTTREVQILYLLIVNEGRVVSYSRLIEYALGYANESSSILLKTHISHLRRKLDLNATGPGSLRSISGIGYILSRSAPVWAAPGDYTEAKVEPAVHPLTADVDPTLALV